LGESRYGSISQLEKLTMPASSATPSKDAHRKSRKGELTSERILDAAEKLFAERGYAGTSLRDVATAVGIRIPSLYNHFESKEALYAAVLERGMKPVLRALSDYAVPGRDGGEDPRKLVATMMSVLATRPGLAGLIQHETLTGGEHLTPTLRSWMAPIFARGDELVEGGLGGSRWDRDELSLLVLAMYHIIVGYFTIAPLYKLLNGRDLLSEEMLERQVRVYGDLVELIFETPPAK
jgi:AcrR family transcriptional regulator